MTPTIFNISNIVIVPMPSKTYELDIEYKVIKSKTDNTFQSIQQAIYLMLSVERYKYAIFSWNYGIEIQDLFGKDLDYVIAKLPIRISDALTQDDRIKEVKDFKFTKGKRSLLCEFTCVTVAGLLNSSMEVSI